VGQRGTPEGRRVRRRGKKGKVVVSFEKRRRETWLD
jgi:hypothetical protein